MVRAGANNLATKLVAPIFPISKWWINLIVCENDPVSTRQQGGGLADVPDCNLKSFDWSATGMPIAICICFLLVFGNSNFLIF